MKFLHTADLHLGRFLDGRPRWDEQEAVLTEIVGLAAAHQADIVLLAGDIFDGFIPPARAERLFYAFVEQLAAQGQAVVAIAGNHDQPQRLAAAAPLAAHRNIHLLGRGEGECLSLSCADGMTARVAALPYVSEARAQELFSHSLAREEEQALGYRDCLQRRLAALSTDFGPDTANLVLAHLFVNGGLSSDSERPLAAQVGGSFGVDAGVFPPGTDYVALGHLHRPQSLGQSQPLCRYAGSPLAYSFSEADQVKSVSLGQISREGKGKRLELEVVPLRAGRSLTRWHCSSYGEALARCQDPALAELWVQLRVELDQPLSGEQLDQLQSAHPRLVGVDPVYPQLESGQEQAATLAELNILQRFAAFSRQSEGVEPDEELLAAFAALLNEDDTEAELKAGEGDESR